MSIAKTDLKKYQLFAERTAKTAGKILSEGFTKTKRVKYKGVIDPVTEFDLKSEKEIIKRIQKSYPSYNILSEEESSVDNGSDFSWVIDPLDGTVNYAHGLPVYCVSIALQYKGESIVGVVYDPELKEMFSAALGMGACLNGKKIKVSEESKLGRSLLATGFSYNIKKAKKNNLGMFARMMKKAQAVRRLGSAALDLCYLACGRFEGFWEYYLHPWDTAAAILIVTEAGGKVSCINGKPYNIFEKDLLASNKLIHNSMKKALTTSFKKK